MTETLDPMDQSKIDHQKLAQQLLAQAKADGVELVGPNGLLNQLTANVLETALEAEMDEHLGYEKHQVEGRGSGNSRNGRRAKTVLTEIGPVQIQVPRDHDSSFDPQIVKKRQRRLTGVDEIILSLSAKGLTTGEISAHFDDVYGASVSKDTISKIPPSTSCRKVPPPPRCSTRWRNGRGGRWIRCIRRKFIDAIHVKIRDGQVTNRPWGYLPHAGDYVAIGVTVDGHRDILGLWAGDGGEGAKFFARRADRDQEPWHRRCLHRGV
ncbi:transposase [Rhodococcus sp. TAF43]|uniref:transposase n=1 Tax=Rhodococcus sp. TAF43 TaxID=3237483 RepID=UPI003F9E4650